MAVSTIQKSITDIRQMSVEGTLTAGSDHLTVTASIPSGYKFLTWTTVTISGAIVAFNVFWESNDRATVYVTPTQSANKTVALHYFVYK